jgi:hypothetical protein
VPCEIAWLGCGGTGETRGKDGWWDRQRDLRCPRGAV